MAGKEKRERIRIPEFKNIEEKAEFWDTHDLTDFLDELQPVNVHFANELSHGIIIDLDSETFSQLCRKAADKGVNPIELATILISEHLKKEDG